MRARTTTGVWCQQVARSTVRSSADEYSWVVMSITAVKQAPWRSTIPGMLPAAWRAPGELGLRSHCALCLLHEALHRGGGARCIPATAATGSCLTPSVCGGECWLGLVLHCYICRDRGWSCNTERWCGGCGQMAIESGHQGGGASEVNLESRLVNAATAVPGPPCSSAHPLSLEKRCQRLRYPPRPLSCTSLSRSSASCCTSGGS